MREVNKSKNDAAFSSRSLNSLDAAMFALREDVNAERVWLRDGCMVDTVIQEAEKEMMTLKSHMAQAIVQLREQMIGHVQRCAAAYDTLDTDRVHARIHIHLRARTD